MKSRAVPCRSTFTVHGSIYDPRQGEHTFPCRLAAGHVARHSFRMYTRGGIVQVSWPRARRDDPRHEGHG